MPSIYVHSVELRHLRYFCAVADAGNITRAAAAIGLRQPTLSQQIGKLEEALGEELFQRGRHSCRPTAAGELLLPYARRVVGEMEALRHALNDLSGLKRGSLTLGTLPVFAERLLPRALAAFHKAHPGIQVRVLELSVDEMARALGNGSVDLCIGNVETKGPLMNELPLFEEELVAVVEQVAGRRRKEFLTVAELARSPVIVPPAGYGTRTLILKAWTKARHMPIFAMEANSTELVLQTVAAGGGIGVVPASALWGRARQAWTVQRIHRPVLRRRISVWQAQVGRRSPAAEALLPHLRQAVFFCHAETPLLAGSIALAFKP